MLYKFEYFIFMKLANQVNASMFMYTYMFRCCRIWYLGKATQSKSQISLIILERGTRIYEITEAKEEHPGRR